MDDLTVAKNHVERLRALNLPEATAAAALIEEQAEKLRFYHICCNTAGLDDIRSRLAELEARAAAAGGMPIYGLFDHNTRHYYEDDGGGNSSSETLLDADTDPDALRARFNAHFALPRTIDMYRNNRYVIPEGQMRSNTGHGSGGGCGSEHTFIIRELPKLPSAQ